METHFIEAVHRALGPGNHGKFMLGRFTPDEWRRASAVDAVMGLDTRLLRRCGWGAEHVLVWDLETGEGAIFRPGGFATADLEKHRVWVCPMFEPFLEWLYEQDLRDLTALPSIVELPDAPFEGHGHRRQGPPKPAE